MARIEQPTGFLGSEESFEAVQRERDQLRQALETRIVIEQAKGVLAERFRITVDEAFELLRASARTAQMKIHALAEQVVGSRDSPAAIIRGLAHDSRLRAAAMREVNEAIRDKAFRLRELHAALVERLELNDAARRTRPGDASRER